MAQPRRSLPSPRDLPWAELRKHASVVVRWLQAGWNELSADEREDVRKLVAKSRGRPRNLTRDETRRLGRLAGKAAAAAARSGKRR